jgi:hypothetical protein
VSSPLKTSVKALMETYRLTEKQIQEAIRRRTVKHRLPWEKRGLCKSFLRADYLNDPAVEDFLLEIGGRYWSNTYYFWPVRDYNDELDSTPDFDFEQIENQRLMMLAFMLTWSQDKE